MVSNLIWDLEAIGPNGLPLDIFGEEIKPLSEEQKSEMSTLMARLAEMSKETDFKVITPDLSRLEERAAQFYVEVCSDEEMARIARIIKDERDKDKSKVIVLGAGSNCVGTLTGAFMSSLSSDNSVIFSPEILEVPKPEKEDSIFFLDHKRSKLRKGPGHNKFKKGKKK